MRHKKVFLFLIVMCLFAGCYAPAQLTTPDTSPEQDFTKQWETQVYTVPFSDDQGNDLTYHICLTTYFEAVPNSITELDIHAIAAVFDVTSTVVQKKIDISGYPAAIYRGEGCSYLCCTSSPETSMVLEYDPEILGEEDALRIMQSVFEPVQS